MHVIEISLSTPGISFAVTPSNGAKPGDTVRQRTSDFAAQTSAQIAINGTFYTTAGSGPAPGGGTEYYADLTYFCYSGGTPVSTWSGTGDPDERGINLSALNQAAFIKPYAINQADYETRPVGTPLYNAIGSYDGILIGNAITATDANLNPRTAMGLNSNKSKLFLFTVDGRQPGYSEGMTTIEIAQLLQNEYGVTDAINLDGGGSTTLVFADPAVRVLNRPSDGTERLHGCNLGVFAVPAQPPVLHTSSAQSPGTGSFQFTFSGTRGGIYNVEVSTNLADWSVTRTMSLTSTNAVFLETNACCQGRFYRVKLAP